MEMKNLVCLIGLGPLICWTASACLAQQSGPKSLADLLDESERAPLMPPSTSEDKPAPLMVPDNAAVTASRDLIKQAYEQDYTTAVTSPESLIRELLAAASQSKDSVSKYAILLEAEEVAALGGDIGRTMELIDIRATVFDFDGLRSRIERLTEFFSSKSKTDPEVLPKLHEHAMATAERAMKQDSLKHAKTAALMAAGIAKSLLAAGKAKRNGDVMADGAAKQTQAQLLIKAIERRTRHFEEYQEAIEILRDKEDPAANGVIGRYLCFEKGDWKEGLPFLAKGDQQTLADVAALELNVAAAGKPDVQHIFDLASRWWDVAKESPAGDSLDKRIKQHAGDLYASVANQLVDPLDKQLALARSAAEQGPPALSREATGAASDKADAGDQMTARRARSRSPAKTGKLVDLLGLVAPARDTIQGKWEKTPSGALVFDNTRGDVNGKLEIPIEPPAAYDVVVDVEPKGGARHLILYIPVEGTSRFTFVKLPASVPEGNGGAAVFNVHLRVRGNRAAVAVNGLPANCTFKDTASDSYWKLRNGALLGLGAWESSFVIHRAGLLEEPSDGTVR